MLTARAIPMLSDNYAWLLTDTATGATGFVDPADEAATAAAIDAAGGKLGLILITHHHHDHIGAVEQIRARYGAKVVGAVSDAHRLPKLDQAVHEGDTVTLGQAHLRVIDTPGHCRGHISYYAEDGAVLLCADTLFSLGCGRLSEDPPEVMFHSLRKLAALPGDTLVCCGHEYTQSNARFALSVDPGNQALQARAREIDRLRAAGQPTIPSRLDEERAANPFLRAPDAATFAKLRSQKDSFR